MIFYIFILKIHKFIPILYHKYVNDCFASMYWNKYVSIFFISIFSILGPKILFFVIVLEVSSVFILFVNDCFVSMPKLSFNIEK